MTLEAMFSNFFFTAKHGMYSFNIKTVFFVLGIELIDSLSDSSTSVETSTKSFHQRWVDLGRGGRGGHLNAGLPEKVFNKASGAYGSETL